MKTEAQKWYYKINYARVDNTKGEVVEGHSYVLGTSEEDAVETLRWNMVRRKSTLKWFQITGQLATQGA
jgi:hypothetical protein